MHESLQTLQTDGVAMMPYSLGLQQKVAAAARLWQEFRSLPLEEKQQLSTNNQGAGSGYEYKMNVGNHTDYKENFDVALMHQSYLEGLLTDMEPTSLAARFARAALDLAGVMHPLTMQFARQAEAEFALPDFARMTDASRDRVFVRFLHYPGGRAAGDIIAEPHADQSGFTFHLYETDRGCQRLDYTTRRWIDMPVERGHTAVFPAMQLQNVSHGTLRALAHRVIATPQTSTAGRDAIVCFNQLANTPVYDKAHNGRLQEREPGFNYDMTAEEFAKLFT